MVRLSELTLMLDRQDVQSPRNSDPMSLGQRPGWVVNEMPGR